MTALLGTAAGYVGGRWVTGDGDPIVTINPATGAQLALTPATGPGQVAAALSAARAAYDHGEWSRVGPADRGAMLHRLADLLEQNRDLLTRLAATEVGTPVSSGSTLHVDLPAKFFRWFADAAVRGPREGYEQQLPLDHDPITASSMLLRQPAGVVAAIVAYNVPIMMSAYKLGAALAAGCSAVLVTSPRAILLTSAFVELLEEAGFPSGTVNFVFGPPAVTEQVVTAPEVDMVTFTGSAAVGAKILALAAPTLKKVVLELGGKSPNIVLPGTDLARAVPASALRFTRNSGQACGATTRTLVPQADFEEYVDRSARYLGGLTVGDPLASDTVLGPLITAEHRGNVEGFIARARETGGQISVGGGRPAGLDAGFYLEATLITGVCDDAEIVQEELFAPVCVVLPYDDLEDAIRMAGNTKYALNANVWGPTTDAIAVARRLRSGTVTINGGGGMRADAPWGGPGHSGIGREGGEEGLREFFEVKHVQWPV